jgi:hypothetical protein
MGSAAAGRSSEPIRFRTRTTCYIANRLAVSGPRASVVLEHCTVTVRYCDFSFVDRITQRDTTYTEVPVSRIMSSM